jgi:hypothetical protein
VRSFADFQHGPAHREQAARREVADAEVQVEVELITGQRHPGGPARDKLGDRRVHHRHLPLRVGRSIGSTPAATSEPVVPGQPGNLVEHRFARQLPLAYRRPADDHDDPAAVSRAITDTAQPGLQALT